MCSWKMRIPRRIETLRRQSRVILMKPKIAFFLVLATVGAARAQEVTTASPVISVRTADAQIPCNASAAFAQIPGRRDYFIGRGGGVGTLDFCHNGGRRDTGFLALYKFDWTKHEMTLVKYLFRPQRPPARYPGGVWSAYDPTVVAYKGEIWVAFECAVPETVASCLAPLTKDDEFEFGRLSVVVKGDRRGSASTPVIVVFKDHPYLYWTIDAEQNQLHDNPLVSRGVELYEDTDGRMWGVGSGGHSMTTDDPHLTTLVDDVDPADSTADHVAHLRFVTVVNDRLLAITTLGGLSGREVCRSSHDVSPGCWRMDFSITDQPLAPNGFRARPTPWPAMPDNMVEYPRIIEDAAGRHLLLGQFIAPKAPEGPLQGHARVPDGVRYLNFEAEFDRLKRL